jgi:hypothetical protein
MRWSSITGNFPKAISRQALRRAARLESRAAEDGAQGGTGAACFADLQTEYAAAPKTEARRAAK